MNNVRFELCNLRNDPRTECQRKRYVSIHGAWEAVKDEKTAISIRFHN